MKFHYWPILISSVLSAAALKPVSVTVGQNLETTATVALDSPAPDGGLQVTLTSTNPTQLLLSATPDKAGSASITVLVRPGMRSSGEFYVQGFADHGTATYTATAAGFDSGDGTVTLAPSSIVISGPSSIKNASFQTTAGSRKSRITVYPVVFDAAGNPVSQAVAGGLPVKVELTSSDPAVGILTQPQITLEAGMGRAVTEFQPISKGKTTLAATPPPGFSAPSRYASIAVVVDVPSLGVTDGATVGKNLQFPGTLNLGAEAPEGGLKVTLTSNDPKRLLLASTPVEKGAASMAFTIPPRGFALIYYLQALSDSGTVTYTASAAGYLPRTGTVNLAPSGVVLVGPLTLPEGQLLRSEKAGGARAHGFVATLGASPTRVYVCTVWLDPVSHRGADITIQTLRPGISLTVQLKSENPAIGTVLSPVTIQGGQDQAESRFDAVSAGETMISVVTPEGYTQSSNDSTLKAIVRP